MRVYTLALLLCTTVATGQPSSVLSTGTWARVTVGSSGIYKLDYNLFQQLGFSSSVDPRKIGIYVGQNGMLPQSNQATRISDLVEVPIVAIGESDGRFDVSDYLLFYAEGPDTFYPDASIGFYRYENHLYSDKAFVYVTVKNGNGLRMTHQASQSGSFPIANTFHDAQVYENDLYSELHSGREWYGEAFDLVNEYTVRFDFTNVVSGSTMKIGVALMGQSFSASSFDLFLNDQSAGSLQPASLINSQYSRKGARVVDTLEMNATTVGATGRSSHDVRIRFNKASSGRSVGYLDYVILQCERQLRLYGNQSIFQNMDADLRAASTWQVAGMTSSAFVWDITDPHSPRIQDGQLTGDNFSFSLNSTQTRFIASSGTGFKTPIVAGTKLENQNLHGMAVPDYLIITAPEFRDAAERLASYRQATNGVAAAAITTEKIYHEFSGGKQDVVALRDFIRSLYLRDSRLKYVLLLGRGSYDYKDRLTFNRNFVPAYESRNSLDPLETYASDDFFGFMDPTEGEWKESPAESATLDLAVGRIPVYSIADANSVVDKLIQYESAPAGSWMNQVLFVADDGDLNLHQNTSDQLATMVETNLPSLQVKKVYLDTYPQVAGTAGTTSPKATDALVHAIQRGVSLLNFSGHGNEQQWMQERILDASNLDRWKSKPRYPFLITATCEFGRSDDPGIISTAEAALYRAGGGTIGLVTTTRPVYSSTNFTLNKAFYDALAIKVSGAYRRIGDIFKDTKNNSISGVNNRNFSLMADPMLRLHLPEDDIVLSSIVNETSSTDTLKRYATVSVTGMVRTGGNIDNSFNGKVRVALFDKRASTTTLGDENAPYTFTQWDNKLFDGQAIVTNGSFELSFTMPSSMDIAVKTGRWSMFGWSEDRKAGGFGAAIIGKTEVPSSIDTEGPSIELFVGDTTFISGGIASPSTSLIALLTDPSGINTSGFDTNTEIKATLDGTTTYLLRDYYVADPGNVGGRVVFPFLENMTPGSHVISLSASDVFGNVSSQQINFVVTEGLGLVIERLVNYPNPVETSTTFRFLHNRSGEDLEVRATVYSSQGQLVMSTDYLVQASSYQVDLPSWDGTSYDGTKLGAGLYLLKVSVRSVLDGAKNEKITKVILLN